MAQVLRKFSSLSAPEETSQEIDRLVRSLDYKIKELDRKIHAAELKIAQLEEENRS